MATPDQIRDSIVEVLSSSGKLPATTSYVTFEPDAEGAQADLLLPIVEVRTEQTIRSDPFNTDIVDVVTDQFGNEIGCLIHYRYEMDVSIRVWTAETGPHDPEPLMNTINRVLREYDKAQMDKRLPDPVTPTQPLKGAVRIRLGESSPDHDMTMDFACRRWEHIVEVYAFDEINTVEEYGPADYIRVVHYPADGDFIAGTGQASIEYKTPP